MREGKFIDKNIDRWKTYMDEQHASPDELANRFTYIVDDLAYAKTFYPTSKITSFINGLAAKMFQSIYQHKNKEASRLLTFWKFELPLIIKKHHQVYFFTLGFFLFFTLISVIASVHDLSFIRNILGDGYVDMTEENIAKGDPFGVYKEGNSFGMFINIASHNIRIALMTCILGLMAGVGTLYLLFQNALMLGSFQYMFFAKGLGWKSVLVIWIHGTIEISSIVLAGTAGLILAKGLLFPGTYKRIESLKQCSKDGIKLIICLIPFFIIAAFLEGYITRLTNMPLIVSLFILLTSALGIVFYFIVYPILLSKTGIEIIDGKVVYPNT